MESDFDTSMCEDEEDEDEEYHPSLSSSDSELGDVDDVILAQNTDSHTGHSVYLIFWACLLELISKWCSCPTCGCRQVTAERRETGSMLHVHLSCSECLHKQTWHSQPHHGKMAAGNIFLSAAILLAGATVTKVLRVLSHMGVAVTTTRTFMRHQAEILRPSIVELWKERQAWLISALQADDEEVVCGGDGRADSPGRSAKFGTYTMMELKKKVIIDIQIVQVCLLLISLQTII